MKKKVLSILTAAVMCVAFLVGCGSSTASSAASAATCEESEFDAIKAQYGDDVFAPDSSYDVYTVIEYTIESAGATFAATVSKKADNSEYKMQFLFYGDEQSVVWDGTKVVEDKTGFMESDAQPIVEAAEANGKWAAIQ